MRFYISLHSTVHTYGKAVNSLEQKDALAVCLQAVILKKLLPNRYNKGNEPLGSIKCGELHD
jgi:hypothetical protein